MTQESQKKILFIIGSLGLGGAESQMALLIRELIKKGHICTVFVLEASGPLREPLGAYGAMVHDGGYDSVSPSKAKKIFLLLRSCARLWRVVRTTKYDVLHAYLPLTNFLGAFMGRLAGIKCIITSKRALSNHQDRSWIWKPMDHVANVLSHGITVNSKAVRDDTVVRDKVAIEKLTLIYNGIDFEIFRNSAPSRESVRKELGLDKNTLGIIVVANLIPYKGHEDFLRALGHIKSLKPLHVYCVGQDHGIQASLITLAGKLGVSKPVTFLGRRSDVPSLMAAMDMFIMPSHEEGFSNALLEAMLSGLPIIATRVGGNAEALEDGRLGLLVAPHDPFSLAVAMNRLMSDVKMRQSFGELAKKTVQQKYSVEALVSAHIKLYMKG